MQKKCRDVEKNTNKSAFEKNKQGQQAESENHLYPQKKSPNNRQVRYRFRIFAVVKKLNASKRI